MSAFTVDDTQLELSYSVEVATAGSASSAWVSTLSSGLGVEMVSTSE